MQWAAVSSQDVGAQPAVEVPFLEDWAGSGHADADAEAFRHWDEDDPQEVPARCAKCHSSPGYLDFLGVDGSEAGKVDSPAPIDTVIECVTCHNDATLHKDSVVMPSGVELTDLGSEARCMECHQGRASKVSVDGAIEEANVADADTVSEDLGFVNIHYYAAAASKYGKIAQGGYEYEGQAYDANFAHVEGYESCTDCHSPHTLEVLTDECSECHTAADLKEVRMAGSLVDYDGDGNLEEGIYHEIEGLQALLYMAMQDYAEEHSGTAIGYESHNYPYFFADANADGQISEDEAVRDNGYNAWTPRLLKAAYNYQLSKKDPGMYAHGGKYIIQLLYDSIADLNTVLSTPVDLAEAHRIDHGHFAGSEEAFRHW
ncbi:polyheme membrane-associated cytochrome C, partial [candidate division KSB3 bacterium]|nr:polyheme membrane-associated cytochrome C [candidate division KSB3 bacterium]MBD3323422.1 polyheme membrane-associated cytochrome C [candidate division KSB3 bacterium]